MASTIAAGTTSGTAIAIAGDTSGVLQLQTNGTTAAVTINTSQNVGIGTSSPDSKLHVKSTVDNTTNGLTLEYDLGTAYKSRVFTRGNNLNISADTGNTGGGILFLTAGGTERASITSSGYVLVNKTVRDMGCQMEVKGINPIGSEVTTATGTGLQVTYTPASGTVYWCNWTYNGSNMGSITSSGSTTAYNTGSDYRLKENIAPITGALAKVAQLKPSTWTWKRNGSDGQGFIAHELQAVVPDCVTGEKDAMRTEQYEIRPAIKATFDEEGNELTPAVEAVMGEREVPDYQGIDTSFLVATLTAAIQELKAELDATKAEVQALKGVA
jgi:hypothetical protein